MIANDGNIMEHAVAFPNAQSQDLPVQGIAERYDIVVDFSQFAPGTRLYLVNLLGTSTAAAQASEVPLADVLSGAIPAIPRSGGSWNSASSAIPASTAA